MASSAVFKKLEQDMEKTTSGQQGEPEASGKGRDRAEKGGGGGRGGKGRGRGRAKKIAKRRAANQGNADANDSQVGVDGEPQDSPPKWNSMAYPIEAGSERPKTAVDDFMHVTLEAIQKYEQRLRNRTVEQCS